MRFYQLTGKPIGKLSNRQVMEAINVVNEQLRFYEYPEIKEIITDGDGISLVTKDGRQNHVIDFDWDFKEIFDLIANSR